MMFKFYTVVAVLLGLSFGTVPAQADHILKSGRTQKWIDANVPADSLSCYEALDQIELLVANPVVVSRYSTERHAISGKELKLLSQWARALFAYPNIFEKKNFSKADCHAGAKRGLKVLADMLELANEGGFSIREGFIAESPAAVISDAQKKLQEIATESEAANSETSASGSSSVSRH